MLNFLKRKKNSPIKYATFSSPYDGQIGNDSTSFAAIDLICSAFATLGFDFYNYYNREKTEHNLKELLDNPNVDDTRFQFLYNSAKDYFESGNVFWYKYDIDGKIVSLFRIIPKDIMVKRNSINNEKIFYYNGTIYNSDKIIHIPSRFGFNGLTGQSIFDMCKEIFTTASSLDLYLKNSFSNNVGKRLIIDIGQGDKTQEQIDEIKEQFIRNYATIQNSGKPLIKRKDLSYDVIDSGMNDNRAAQLEENRKFQEMEIAKILRVPIELLHGNMQGKDIESVYCLFLDNAVRPLATQFEQIINKYLLNQYEQRNIYFEYNYNSLMKTNLQTRIDTYSKQFMNGILSINEIRQKENLPVNSEDAADTLFIPSNLMPLKDKQINSLLASAQLKLNALKSNSDDFHSQNPSGLGDDKL